MFANSHFSTIIKFFKFTRKHLCLILVFNEVEGLQSLTSSKKRFRHRCFVNSAKFLIKLPLKNPLGGCFYINIRSVYCPTTTFFFSKTMSLIFSESFLGLIYRFGTRVSSIFQTLSQTLTTHSKICDEAFFQK